MKQKAKVKCRHKRANLQEKRRMTEQHRELRQQTLQELEKAREAACQQPLADIISKIRSKERFRNSCRKIKSTFNPTQMTQFTMLDVPDLDQHGFPTNDPETATSWKALSDP
jgi:hypothetical protein